MYAELITFLNRTTRGTAVLSHASLSDKCTFGIGGKADILLSPETEEELIICLDAVKARGIPFRVIGNASHLLFSDRGFRGAVIRTAGVRRITESGGVITAACGTPLPYLCRYAADRGLGALYGLCGIPATVGGAIYTAAGAFGCNIYSTAVSCRIYSPDTGEITERRLTDAAFSYRKSPFTEKSGVILSVSFKPPRENGAVILGKMAECSRIRRASQPVGEKSAGSYFRRPENAPPAAELIDRAGLKGLRRGGAQVSLKHAGFIVNTGGASCRDVLTLAEEIKNEILKRYGIALTEEVIAVPEKAP